ncbi:MAG: DUF4249 domain-containing protein [Phycisphaerae bacterium]|nr:DUF4249 domain-containing protein [Gemmatimonadaceae bacterium]
MIRTAIHRAFVLASLLGLTACERVVDLNIPEGPRRLVIEARLERVKEDITGTQVIKLSTTGKYFANTLPEPARGAVVRVTDDRGFTHTFAESGVPGTYVTYDLIVFTARTYTLSIEWEGTRFESTDRGRPVAPIDSFYFDNAKPGRYSGVKGVRATISLVDRPGEKNFYLWEQYVNGVRQLGPDSTTKLLIIASDEGYDGLPINGFQPYEGIDIPRQAAVEIRQLALSEDMYRYFFALSDIVNSDGSPFSVPPSNLRGNVVNRTNPAMPPVGYFFVTEVSQVRGRYLP